MPEISEKQVKKLAAVSAIFTSATASSKILQLVPYISYPIQFQRGHGGEVRALIDSGSEVNPMSIAFAAKLGLSI